MTKFTKFSAIENTYREKTINLIIEAGLESNEWFVSEKVHGANFSIWVDSEGNIKFAKKSGFISGNENFYNHTNVISELDDIGKQVLSEAVSYIGEDIHSLAIYGEYAGGTYPHEDVDKVGTAKKVQKGVYYHPGNIFYGFDIKVNGLYLNPDVTNYIFSEIESPIFCYAKDLYAGDLKGCLEYPNDKPSLIHEEFNLPAIEDNIMEGVVIKPAITSFLGNGNRVILKNKNAKFAERERGIKTPKAPIRLSESADTLLQAIRVYITENRLRNIISHEGTFTQKDFGKLQGLFIKDTLKDALKEDTVTNISESLEKNERRIVNRIIGREAAVLIRTNWLNIIDGGF